MEIEKTKFKKGNKKFNKKNINREIKIDIDYYEYQKSLNISNNFKIHLNF